MIMLSESTMARSRPTATLSLRSACPYKASATSPGSVGRGSTHSRPSPICGGLTMCGPRSTGFAARAVSAFPTGAGVGTSVSRTATAGTERPSPPLGPGPRLEPPNAGSSTARGGAGGMIVMSVWCRSMRQEAVTTVTTSARCSRALATQVSGSRGRAIGSFHESNSGEHLSQPLGRLDQARHGDRERDAEEPFAARAESAARERDDALVLERATLKRRGSQTRRQRYPDVHRGPRRLGLEALRGKHRQHRVPAFLELRDVFARQRLRLGQYRGPRRLDREESARVHVVLHARERRDQLRAPHGPPESPPR